MTSNEDRNAQRRYLRAVRKFAALRSDLEGAPHDQQASIELKILQAESHITANFNPTSGWRKMPDYFAFLSHDGLSRLPDSDHLWITLGENLTEVFLSNADLPHLRTAVAKGWNPGASLPQVLSWAKGDAARETFICEEMASHQPFWTKNGTSIWMIEETYIKSAPDLLGRCIMMQICHYPEVMKSVVHDAALSGYFGIIRILLRSGAPKPAQFNVEISHPGILDEIQPPSNHVALKRLAERQHIAGLISRTVASAEGLFGRHEQNPLI